MSSGFWTEGIGVGAALCTAASFAPQLARVWKRKSAEDISLLTYLVFSMGLVLWLWYGVRIGSVAVLLANSVTLVMTGMILVLKVRYDRKARLERMEAGRVNLGE